MNDGRVLICGGYNHNEKYLSSSEIFDPDTEKFSSIGGMNTKRRNLATTLLANGYILVTGGYNYDSNNNSYNYLSTAELFNPATETFSTIGDMNHSRHGHRSIQLENGKILIVGYTSSSEIYDSQTEIFSKIDNRGISHGNVSGLRLNNGNIFLISSYGVETYVP